MIHRLIIILSLITGLCRATDEFTEEGFRVPVAGAALEFPRAHASHPDFKIEWWYLTGHLQGAGGERFGYQATFFRNAAPLADRATEENTHFGDSQFYMAHAAVTDIGGKTFHHQERINRNGWDADASTAALDVRNGNWTLRMPDPATETMELAFSIRGDVRATLRLVPRKPLVRFGEDGVSRKGAHPHATSYYLSFTRLETTGTIRLGGRDLQVTGESWMDHEIASRQLSGDLEGWDWTAIQLDDGRELKAYILRRPDGTADPFSRAIWIDRDGGVESTGPAGFSWDRDRWWRSPQTGTRYPVGPVITTTDPQTGAAVRLRLRPHLDEQEFIGAISYWEGACEVLDDATGRPVGRAYLELAGYAAALGDRLR